MIEQENKEKEKEKDRQFSGVIGEPETSKVLSHFCVHTFFSFSNWMKYLKNPKNLGNQEAAVIILKFECCGFNIAYAEVTANSVNPGQTGSWGAVWSESTIFVQTCLSKN